LHTGPTTTATPGRGLGAAAAPANEHRLVEILHLDAVFQSAAASASIREALRFVYKDCAGGRFCAVALVRGGASADLAHLACLSWRGRCA
jgi:hypothetical protein